MFGVLVVRDQNGRLGYLSGYSGMLADQWRHDDFVPPVFDVAERTRILAPGEHQLQILAKRLRETGCSREARVRERWLHRAQRRTERQMVAMRQRNLERKRARDQVRQSANGACDEGALARQSSEDRRELRLQKSAVEARLAAVRAGCESFDLKLRGLREQRRSLSRQLQTQLFDGYSLCATNSDRTTIAQLFDTALPPGGAGDCAAPKLLQYANLHGLRPICLAEFWWEPGVGQCGLRRHGSFYPACRSKCGPILPFLLTGVDVEPAAHLSLPLFTPHEPRIVYEDRDIIVVSKPSGMLSVPGKWHSDSVESRLNHRYDEGKNHRMLVHRLDQATSGLLLAARNRRAHKVLHQQFEQRQIDKRYVAELEAVVQADTGQVDLPLRVDLDDRPRQLVCFEHGKPALTRFAVIGRSGTHSRVHFFPRSGRTHQLRVHAAHPKGLGAPIVGDELYGRPGTRLRLHADYLRFQHPSGHIIEFCDPAPF